MFHLPYMPPRVSRLVLVLGLAVAMIALCYGDAIFENVGRSHWEDQRFFVYGQANIHSVGDCFRRSSYWQGLYRPLSANLYYYLGNRLFADDLIVYHMINVVLYLVNIALAYWVCLSFASFEASLAVALLFGSRLANTEVLLYTSQVQSLLPWTFSLLALKSFLVGVRRGFQPLPMIIAAVLVVAGLLSKETALTTPVLCLLVAWIADRPPKASRSWRDVSDWIALAVLPLVSVGTWYVVARPFLRIADSYFWEYEKSSMEVVRNLVAYAGSFVNPLVYPFRRGVPAAMLDSYAGIMAVRNSGLAGYVILALVGASSIALMVGRRAVGGHKLPHRLVWVAFGLATFVATTLPAALLHERRLMYYGYPGHFGLAVAVVLASEPLVRWLLDAMNRVVLPSLLPSARRR